jgi:hypothetical protein
MTQIVLSDAEVKSIGEQRWSQKHNKYWWGLLIAAFVLSIGGIKIASNYPNSPIGFFVALIIGAGLIMGYVNVIHKPMRKAGEEFLKEFRQ